MPRPNKVQLLRQLKLEIQNPPPPQRYGPDRKLAASTAAHRKACLESLYVLVSHISGSQLERLLDEAEALHPLTPKLFA